MSDKRRKELYNAFIHFNEIEKLTQGDIITPESIDKSFTRFQERYKDLTILQDEAEYIKNTMKMNFDVNLASKAVHISDDQVTPWIKNAKSSIDWKYWDAYEKYLKLQDIPRKSIIQTSEETDDILDLTGNPKIESHSWNKRGLVMGNVQSGKTLNFTGLINKAVDVGYKFIIVIGSINDNNLRMQTQARLDEGFTGFKTSLLPKINPIGVGLTRYDDHVVPFTTSDLKQDFTKDFAQRQSVGEKHIKPEIPFLFVVKKNKTVLNNIYEWFKDHYNLDPKNNDVRIMSPLLFIDDEADWASPDTSKEDEDPKAINAVIRSILGLFNKTNYIAYTATPFANIFINHETTDECLGDDLFPKDFILKLHLSDAYKGQDFYFPRDDFVKRNFDPIIEIHPKADVDAFRPKDHNKKVIKKIDPSDPDRFKISSLTESLKDAIRCFVINNSIRVLRGDKYSHNTMLVNVTHRIILMNDIGDCVQEYFDDLKNNIRLSVGLSKDKMMQNSYMRALNDTYQNHYKHLTAQEDFDKILKEIDFCAQKIEIRVINSDKSGSSLDYDSYDDVGLSVIAIGGNKLSRGLTLKGLNVSYFDRTSRGSDTLTQMCRWFGYRPGYEDICKVYLSSAYRNHYQNISRIIDDLYQELEYMKSQRRTPREYGIKVREHPDNITITAKNKMRNAKTLKERVDFWGRTSRHGMFRDNDDTNNKNNNIFDKFLSLLKSKYSLTRSKDDKDIIFHDIEYDHIINFLNEIDIQTYTAPAPTVVEFIEMLKKNKCPSFKVLIVGAKSNRDPDWYKTNKPCDKRNSFEANRKIMISGEIFGAGYRSMEKIGNFIKYPRYAMGNPTDENVLFTETEMNAIKNEYKGKPLTNAQYRETKIRNFPVIKLYFYNLFIENDDEVVIPFSRPTVGFEISFPKVENVADTPKERDKLTKNINLSYAYNTVAQQLELEYGRGIDDSKDE